jgi:uncharacterized protein (DUF2252 family)
LTGTATPPEPPGAPDTARPSPDAATLVAAGRAARKALTPATLGEWTPARDRPDPIGLLEEQAATRFAELVPVRYGRMSVSPFTFYRGAALPMAADLASRPNTGIIVQLCGDAHLSNFGLFASPERTLVFDINDFDETLHGPFEFDLMRLSASLVVAARDRGFSAHEGRHAVHRAIRSYAAHMQEYAAMRAIDVYYSRVDAAAITSYVDKRARPMLESTVRSTAHHDALHELPKLTTVVDGHRQIIEHPPTIVRRPEAILPLATAAIADYRGTLQEDRRVLLDRYHLEDYAFKVVGVGSVGLGAFAVLLMGTSDDDPLFLQVKQAEASVYERFLPPSTRPNHGQRVVTGQRRLQAASDMLLGWFRGQPYQRDWYVRQLQDQKGSAVVDAMDAEDLAAWGDLCAWALARGHARSGEPVAISAYIGDDDALERAMGTFAMRYADQNEADHAALLAAIKSGRIQAETGV